MGNRRRSVLKAALGLAGGVVVGAGLLSNMTGAAPAATDDATRYPSRPVKLIVPIAAGGSADKLARTVAQKLSEKWGQSVVVENQPGASSAIGNAAVAHARGDGYTLLLGGDALSLNALQPGKPLYDPLRDLRGVTKAVVNPQLLVVRPGLGVKTFQEFVALVRNRPGEISLALPGGNGSLQHLAVELLNERIGAKTNQIPYPGGGPATLDVLGGHVDAMLITLAAAANVRSGKLVALAVTTPYRSKALPEVPTMQEAGLADYAVESWQGFVVPASTPAALVERIHRDVVAVLREPETATLLENLGFAIAASTPEAVDQTVRDDIATYRRVIATADVKLQ
ncbi:tripartite tricarboxylate transporter substrate binding protein [Achromobacter xylosoxidans]